MTLNDLGKVFYALLTFLVRNLESSGINITEFNYQRIRILAQASNHL